MKAKCVKGHLVDDSEIVLNKGNENAICKTHADLLKLSYIGSDGVRLTHGRVHNFFNEKIKFKNGGTFYEKELGV